MSCGLVKALVLGKNFSTMVCWLLAPTVAPTSPPTRAATTAVATTTHTQLLLSRVWRTTCGAGRP